MNLLKLDVTKITQSQQEFFIGSFTVKHFHTFAKYTERLIIDFDEEGKPIFNEEVQRKTDKGKVNNISDFLIYDNNALFPTNIVVGIPLEAIKSITTDDSKRYKIELDEIVQNQIKNNETPFITIVDGQHRIKGIEKALERLQNKDFEPHLIDEIRTKERIENLNLVVAFFIAPTLEFQANIFSTINRTQTRVTESLVYSLFGLTDLSSPYKTALEVTLALNSKEGSPFHNRIKLYGNYERTKSHTLTQATMVKSIVKFISKNAREAEKEKHFKRNEIKQEDDRKLPFRKFYITNNDSQIAKIMNAYFSAVRDVFLDANGKSYWKFNDEQKSPDNILQTTVGFTSLLNVLKDILSIIDSEYYFDKNVYIDILSTVKDINFEDQETYPFTAKSKLVLTTDIQKDLLNYSEDFYISFRDKLGISREL